MRQLLQKGFTLIELIAVIVVLSITGTALASLFIGVSGKQGLNSELQTATQVGQACAEHILTLRRRDSATGYAGIGGPHCGAAFTFNGFTPNDVTVAYAGSACPAGANCKQVTITTSDGTTTHIIDLLLTDY